MSLYWAYGSNLNHAQMRLRCPGAAPVAPLIVPDAILRFRGVADVAYLAGGHCPGGLWEITAADERTLDHYEGVDRGLYVKRYLTLRVAGVTRSALYYVMLRTGIYPPDQDYFDAILEGYRDFGLDTGRLYRALDHSRNRVRKTRWLRRRLRRRNGGVPQEEAI